MRFRKVLTAGLLAGLLLAGCSAAPDPNLSDSQPAPTASAPEGGVLLAEAGFSHVPPEFSVPNGLTYQYKVDQSNNVSLVMEPDQGELLLDYLGQHLKTMGFTVTGESTDSLTFSAPGWEGAFTMSPETAILVLTHL